MALGQGQGILYSLQGINYDLSGSFAHQNAKFTKNCDVKSIKGQIGTTQTWVFNDTIDELTFTSVPISAGAGDLTASVVVPTLGMKVTVANSPVSNWNTATWVIHPPYEVELGNENEGRVVATLKRASGITPA